MNIDMEYSCDEHVLKKMDVQIKKPYATSLLKLATEFNILKGGPLAFGEGNIKGRIKNVLNYKKPVIWVTLVAVIFAVIVGIGLITNPKARGIEEVSDSSDIPTKHIQVEIMQSGNHVLSGKIITGKDGYKAGDIVSVVISESVTYQVTSLEIGDWIDIAYREVREKDPSELIAINVNNITGDQYPTTFTLVENGEISGEQVSGQTNLEPIAPELSYDQIVGVDMTELNYASDDIIIFHDYFGLFIHDLDTLQIIRSLDLKPISCHYTQGDDYCDISVSMDGNIVHLHPISSENMYVYTVSDNTLRKTKYKPMEDPFKRFVPIEEVIDSNILGNHSHSAIFFDTGEYGYLYTDNGAIGALSYIRGDMDYNLFN